MTPYWSRCRSCGELTYVPRPRGPTAPPNESGSGESRHWYGTETVPLPVLTDPRTRLVEGLLGLTATGLYAVSVPLAIVLLSMSMQATIDDLLRAAGVSLIITLWIFLGIALTATALYASILVLRRKAEAGSAWIAFGIISISFCAMFVALGRLGGAWVGVVASGVILGAGLIDTVLAILKKRASERVQV